MNRSISANKPQCKCCGVTIITFLTIDHINGGGRKHRENIGLYGGYKFYGWLKKHNYPSGFQVLCANCHLGKHINNGICPHKDQKYGQHKH